MKAEAPSVPGPAVHPSHARSICSDRDAHVRYQLVKRVFIMGDCDQLMPSTCVLWGVVDAQDMSLSISREILQQDRQIKGHPPAADQKVLSRSGLQSSHGRAWTLDGRVLERDCYDVDSQEALLGVSFAGRIRQNA